MSMARSDAAGKRGTDETRTGEFTDQHAALGHEGVMIRTIDMTAPFSHQGKGVAHDPRTADREPNRAAGIGSTGNPNARPGRATPTESSHPAGHGRLRMGFVWWVWGFLVLGCYVLGCFLPV